MNGNTEQAHCVLSQVCILKKREKKGSLKIISATDKFSFSSSFRYQNCFHGVDLCQLREAALNEYLRQPIVDTFDIGICLAKSIRYSLDFLETEEKALHHLGELLYLFIYLLIYLFPVTVLLKKL